MRNSSWPIRTHSQRLLSCFPIHPILNQLKHFVTFLRFLQQHHILGFKQFLIYRCLSFCYPKWVSRTIDNISLSTAGRDVSCAHSRISTLSVLPQPHAYVLAECAMHEEEYEADMCKVRQSLVITSTPRSKSGCYG